MADLQSQLILRLIDGVTGPAQKVAGSMRGITAAARSTSLAATQHISRIGGAISAAVSGAGIYAAHDAVMKFATATNKLSAANPDFGLDQIKDVAQLARDVSRQTLFNPAQVMDAANSLARAGVSLDAIKGTLKPLGVSAMAADVPITQLSDDFVKLASNFALPLATQKDAAKTFTYLGDLATYVGQQAPGTFADYVNAMKQVGAAARVAGIDIKWLTGAYIMLDKAGIRNEEAGTALRSLVKHLTQPTLEARKMYAQLGIDPSTFLKGGKQVTADQFVAAFQSEYGKKLNKAAPRIQDVISSSLSTKDKGSALFKIVERMWGGGMKPVDARKIKKTIDNFMYSSTEKIDPQAWMDQLAKKGTTLGQFLRLVEPRQASRLINLLEKEDGKDGAEKKLNTKLSDLPGFREGLAADAGAKMMQGYPAAIKKIQDAFQSLIEILDNAGVIDRVSEAIKRVGEAVTSITKGTAGWKDWAIALGLGLPVLRALSPLLLAVGGAAAFAARGVAGLAGALLIGPAIAVVAAALRGLRTAMIGFAAAGAIAGLPAALRIAGAAMLAMLTPIGLMRGALLATAAAARVLKFALLATGIGAALVAIGAAATFIYNNWRGLGKFFSTFFETLKTNLASIDGGRFKGLSDALESLSSIWKRVTGEISEDSWQEAGKGAADSVASAIRSIADAIDTVLQKWESFKGIWNSVQDVLQFNAGKAIGDGLGLRSGGNPREQKVTSARRQAFLEERKRLGVPQDDSMLIFPRPAPSFKSEAWPQPEPLSPPQPANRPADENLWKNGAAPVDHLGRSSDARGAGARAGRAFNDALRSTATTKTGVQVSGEGLDQSAPASAAGTKTGQAFTDALRASILTMTGIYDASQSLDQSSEAGAAGARTGEAFKANMESELRAVDTVIQQAMARWAAMLGSFSASPSITPQISAPSGGGGPGKQSSAGSGQKLTSLEPLRNRMHGIYADNGFGFT